MAFERCRGGGVSLSWGVDVVLEHCCGGGVTSYVDGVLERCRGGGISLSCGVDVVPIAELTLGVCVSFVAGCGKSS